jgi:hypothetical protein
MRTKLNHQNSSNFQSRGAREQFLPQTPLLNDFLTVRPIFINNTPIDSAKQVEQIEIVEIFQNSNLGEQGSTFCQKVPS